MEAECLRVPAQAKAKEGDKGVASAYFVSACPFGKRALALESVCLLREQGRTARLQDVAPLRPGRREPRASPDWTPLPYRWRAGQI